MTIKKEITLNQPEILEYGKRFIDGRWKGSASGATFDVVDPGSGEVWAQCTDCDTRDVDEAVASSYGCFQSYQHFTPTRRADLLLAWHQLILDARHDIAKILVYETGKPLAEAYGEITYATSFTRWFAGEAERVQGTTSRSALPGRRSLVIKQPIGVAVALVPWNFPVALALRKASAALAAGCTIIIKPSPETPFSASILAYLAHKAGFPSGAINVLSTSLENTPSLSEALCVHPQVGKVSFTGSTRVGKLIAGLCARNLKKSTLELGGNCPFIVFDDANLDIVVAQLSALKWRHAGQACVTANRVYVQTGIFKELVSRLIQDAQKMVLGHGLDEMTTLGPVTTKASVERAQKLVSDALSHGAQIVFGDGDGTAGGNVVTQSGGYFIQPLILSGVTDEMALSQEEIFAPILGILEFQTEAEVIKRANETSMGLAAYVFTTNVNRLWHMFEKIEAGMIGLVSAAILLPTLPM
jgi:succinate-semialdehyde dehydrogenase/glutarate-semialdehyde dehydrogenase